MLKEVVYFHIGQDDYLTHSIKQLLHHNPDLKVYLIGKNVPEQAKELTHFYEMESLYCKQTYNFLNNFKNYSTNNAEFEKICILRWFLIRNLCRIKEIKNTFYLDSDVLIYCKLNKELKKFNNFRYSLTCNTSAGILYITDIKVFDDYLNLVDGFYCPSQQNLLFKNKFSFSYISKKTINDYNIRLQHNMPGGVCDMTFWNILRSHDEPTMVGELSTFGMDGETMFDHNINESNMFKTENNIKKFIWKNKLPYSENLFLGKLIRFNCIHFQGYETKKLIEHFITYD